MAYKNEDGIIVKQKFKLKKIKKIKENLVGRAIYYIAPKTFHLYEGEILGEKDGKYECKMHNRNIHQSSEEVILFLPRDKINFIKRK